MYKIGIFDTKPEIGLSLKRSDLRAKVQSVYRNSKLVYGLSIGNKSIPTLYVVKIIFNVL